MPLVRHAVNRIVAGSSHSSILQYEDMVSCGIQGLLEAYKKQLEESNAPADTIRQITEIMQSPEVFGAVMVLMLGMVFVAFTLPMILGGAVAAKALERE